MDKEPGCEMTQAEFQHQLIALLERLVKVAEDHNDRHYRSSLVPDPPSDS